MHNNAWLECHVHTGNTSIIFFVLENNYKAKEEGSYKLTYTNILEKKDSKIHVTYPTLVNIVGRHTKVYWYIKINKLQLYDGAIKTFIVML